MKAVEISPAYDVSWTLDTGYCHDGIPLSNGVFGALIWFQDRTVMLTINRADYWDHRGGTIWRDDCTYGHLKSLLESGEFEGARELYPTMMMNGKEKRPTRLAMGRFEVRLKPDVRIHSAFLHMTEGEARLVCSHGGSEHLIRLAVPIDKPMLLMSGGGELIESVKPMPSYSFGKTKAYFDDFGILAPASMEDGWVQELPEDPACAVWMRQVGGKLAIAAEYGADPEKAARAANAHLDSVFLSDAAYAAATRGTREHWRALWRQAADIALPDAEIERMYYLGIYRMLGNSMPGKIAPTLQGPWAEEYRNPPWSCDYHFNINVQQCLWPAYGSNLLDCLKPLFSMIDGWKPTLALNAKRFVGIEDGYMLGHSVDDRGRPVGGMWTGTIDQANTSWIAQMMWQYARYAGDEEYMLGEVYPFMKKALNVFRAMMEQGGERYSLPVTVSPEYGGSSQAGLGRNSTFFLVNVRFLCEKLLELEEKYGIDSVTAAIASDICAKLPPYTAGPRQFQEFGKKPGLELYLWEGQPLSESHRHHSHLAGIFPFDTINMDDPAQREAVSNAYKSWIDKGMGRWAGWSMPWASILHNRLGRADMALLSLHLLRELYMMPSYATRHNANYEGFCQFTGGDTMQAEASIAAAAAVLEMYVQCVRGTVRVFEGLSRRFKDASFAGIRAEGAFLLSGIKTGGKVESVTVYSERDETIRLVNPFGGRVSIRKNGAIGWTEEEIITLELHSGDCVVFENGRD
ncbi:hypothetical protein [Paenibacillus sp. LHD-38]|uniref:glycosyl hydrolase family 95 catalytic domain-containing protein n=1 Tax=Paenibacillus sp. LHD-38 TaxID=3072143 RepID=UPI00280DD4EB|nr:hypothetical protein [Paenibacillus sp. LHD-38]MDQ8735371.1 hypothetical protein [Paenibacillus sp. LHD-38]